MHILLVDDEIAIRETVSLNLKQSGYNVTEAVDGIDAKAQFDWSREYDLVILDYMMPGCDGIEVLKYIRQQSNVPVIMLTAKDQEEAKLMAFEFGADDYVTKPFSMKELEMRIKAVLRRFSIVSPKKNDALNLLVNGPLVLNLKEKKCFWKAENALKKEVPLTVTEFRLLEKLLSNTGHIISKETLISRIWDDIDESSQNVLRVSLSRLRKKFVLAGVTTPFISNHSGYGYMIADLSEWEED